MRIARRPFFLLLPLGVLAALPFGRTSPDTETGEVQPLLVETVPVEMVEHQPALAIHGSLAGESRIELSPPVEGRIEEVYVQPGDTVVPGQELAHLVNPQLESRLRQARGNLETARAQVLQAEAHLTEACRAWEARLLQREAALKGLETQKLALEEETRQLEQKKELLALDGISREEYRRARTARNQHRRELEERETELAAGAVGLRDKDIRDAGYALPGDVRRRRDILRHINTEQARTSLQAARSRVTALEQESASIRLLLAELTLRAPCGSAVEAVHQHPGEQHRGNKPILTLIRRNPLYAQFTAAESKISALSPGRPLLLEFPALGNRTEETRITMILPSLEPSSGNLRLKARVQNPEGKLYPGMFFRGSIPLGPPEKLLTLPPETLMESSGDQASCFSVTNGRVQVHQVVTGKTVSGNRSIRRGLQGDEELIVSPPSRLQPGQRVQVISPKGAGP